MLAWPSWSPMLFTIEFTVSLSSYIPVHNHAMELFVHCKGVSHTASGSRQTFLRLAYGDCLLGYTRSTYSASGLISYHTPTTHHSVSPPSPPHIVGRHSPTRVSLTLVQRLLCVRSCPLSHIYTRVCRASPSRPRPWRSIGPAAARPRSTSATRRRCTR